MINILVFTCMPETLLVDKIINYYKMLRSVSAGEIHAHYFVLIIASFVSIFNFNIIYFTIFVAGIP